MSLSALLQRKPNAVNLSHLISNENLDVCDNLDTYMSVTSRSRWGGGSLVVDAITTGWILNESTGQPDSTTIKEIQNR
jgi:hypothetical protein